MLVSVLSGLARSDVDPWQEAAKLTRLPGETAAAELAALIDALPDGAVLPLDAHTVAIRLIALLPRPAPKTDGSQHAHVCTTREKLTNRPWWIYVAFMCFSLGTQFLIANHKIPAKPQIQKMSAVSGLPQPAPPISGASPTVNESGRQPVVTRAQ